MTQEEFDEIVEEWPIVEMPEEIIEFLFAVLENEFGKEEFLQ